jgi:gliding motility-associated protein GldC
MSLKKELKITVNLDEKLIPEKILWQADDAGPDSFANCRAMLLSLWDNDAKHTMKLDLWTKEMTVDEMKLFFYETMVTMADTFENATNDDRMAGDMRDFCDYFADKMDIDTKKK